MAVAKAVADYDPWEDCACGQPLHYRDKRMEQASRRTIALVGDPYVDVVTSRGTYRVQRHYIALHGLVWSEVWRLGFERVN